MIRLLALAAILNHNDTKCYPVVDVHPVIDLYEFHYNQYGGLYDILLKAIQTRRHTISKKMT